MASQNDAICECGACDGNGFLRVVYGDAAPDAQKVLIACSSYFGLRDSTTRTGESRTDIREVMFVIHGGFWKEQWGIANALSPHAFAALAAHRGQTLVLVEYRRVAPPEYRPAFPDANLDVLAAYT